MQAETKWIYYHLKIRNPKHYIFPKITPIYLLCSWNSLVFRQTYTFYDRKSDFRLISCIQDIQSIWFHYEKWYSFSSQHPVSFFLLSKSSYNFSSTICAVTMAKVFLSFARTPCKCVFNPETTELSNLTFQAYYLHTAYYSLIFWLLQLFPKPF